MTIHLAGGRELKPAKDKEFLVPEDLHNKPMDRRCIVCLERAWQLYVGYDPGQQVGCPFGHTSKENCQEFAIPSAEMRAHARELKRQGLIK